MTGRPAGRPAAVRPLAPSDRPWLRDVLDERWGGPAQAYGGELVDAAGATGLVAVDGDGAHLGFILHRPTRAGWEVILLDALTPGAGIGTALVEACAAAARAGGAAHLGVVTTNDNVDALRFYQRRGFRLVEVRPGAVDEARTRLKPAIPTFGLHGIPLRDELVLVRDI